MPKQLLPLEDGRSVLEHSVNAFELSPAISEIAVVMHPEWIDEARHICERNEWRKVKKIIPGGTERWESSWHALIAYSDFSPSLQGRTGEACCLWLHDAARPFVSQRILADVAEALEKHAAVTVAVPSTDTVYLTHDHCLTSMPPRETVMRAQTPQAFRLPVIAEAFRRAIEQGGVAATDDIGILHRFMPEVPVYIVPGDEKNRKITFREDL